MNLQLQVGVYMRNYKLIPYTLLVSISVFSLFYFIAKPLENIPAVENAVLKPPVETVSNLYRSIELGEWEKISDLFIQSEWQKINEQGYLKKWEVSMERDSSLDFVSFVILELKEEDKKHISLVGRAVWVSEKNMYPDETQQIKLQLLDGSWVISEMKLIPAVDMVSEFFSLVSTSNWEAAGKYVTKDILSLSQIQYSSVQLVNFIPEDFAVKETMAWVSGKLVINQGHLRVVSVDVQLTKTNGKWQINQIISDLSPK